MIKAADMLIARRADTRARADFATWTMMAKLNGASSLSPEAQAFLDRYRTLLKDKPEAEASEAVIQFVYKGYYEEMGGGGEPPQVKPHSVETDRTSGNVTAFKRPVPKQARSASGPQAKSRLPVALILVCLVVVYVALRYLFG